MSCVEVGLAVWLFAVQTKHLGLEHQICIVRDTGVLDDVLIARN